MRYYDWLSLGHMLSTEIRVIGLLLVGGKRNCRQKQKALMSLCYWGTEHCWRASPNCSASVHYKFLGRVRSSLISHGPSAMLVQISCIHWGPAVMLCLLVEIEINSTQALPTNNLWARMTLNIYLKCNVVNNLIRAKCHFQR